MGSRVVIEVGYPASVEGGAPPDDTMDGVTLVKEELSQVRTILPWKENSDNFYVGSLSLSNGYL